MRLFPSPVEELSLPPFYNALLATLRGAGITVAWPRMRTICSSHMSRSMCPARPSSRAVFFQIRGLSLLRVYKHRFWWVRMYSFGPLARMACLSPLNRTGTGSRWSGWQSRVPMYWTGAPLGAIGAPQGRIPGRDVDVRLCRAQARGAPILYCS